MKFLNYSRYPLPNWHTAVTPQPPRFLKQSIDQARCFPKQGCSRRTHARRALSACCGRVCAHSALTTSSTADNPARTTKLFCCPMPPGCSAVCCELQCERRVLRQRRDRRLSETMSVRAKRRHCQLPRYLQHIHQALTCTQPLRLPLLRILSRLLPACRFQAAATSCSSNPRLPRATATALLQVCNPTMSQMPRCDTASYCARLPCSCSPTPIHGAACCLLSAACRALLPSTPSSAPPCVRDIACSRPSLPQKSMQQASARAACVV